MRMRPWTVKGSMSMSTVYARIEAIIHFARCAHTTMRYDAMLAFGNIRQTHLLSNAYLHHREKHPISMGPNKRNIWNAICAFRWCQRKNTFRIEVKHTWKSNGGNTLAESLFFSLDRSGTQYKTFFSLKWWWQQKRVLFCQNFSEERREDLSQSIRGRSFLPLSFEMWKRRFFSLLPSR